MRLTIANRGEIICVLDNYPSGMTAKQIRAVVNRALGGDHTLDEIERELDELASAGHLIHDGDKFYLRCPGAGTDRLACP